MQKQSHFSGSDIYSQPFDISSWQNFDRDGTKVINVYSLPLNIQTLSSCCRALVIRQCGKHRRDISHRVNSVCVLHSTTITRLSTWQMTCKIFKGYSNVVSTFQIVFVVFITYKYYIWCVANAFFLRFSFNYYFLRFENFYSKCVVEAERVFKIKISSEKSFASEHKSSTSTFELWTAQVWVLFFDCNDLILKKKFLKCLASVCYSFSILL